MQLRRLNLRVKQR